MKCIEVFDYRTEAGFPFVLGSQCYVSLATIGERDGRRVFLTSELIDQLLVSGDERIYNAELVRQGDGTYWLKPETRQSSSVLILCNEKIKYGKHPNQRQLTAALTGYHFVVSETVGEVTSANDGETYHALGFIAELSLKGVIYVSTIEQKQIPGSGRSWRRPFNRARFGSYYLDRYNIKSDGEKISLMNSYS